MNVLSAILVRLRRLAADEAGATMATTMISLAAVMGFVGLGVDAGLTYANKRQAQTAADAAAFSGAVAIQTGGGDPRQQARTVASQYGFTDNQNGVSVTVSSPPATGGYTGNANAVQVSISQPGSALFSKIINASPKPILANATALAQGGTGGGADCLMALNPTAAFAMQVNGTVDMHLDQCSAYVNSNAGQALLANGTIKITARSVEISGGMLQNGSVTITPTPDTGVAPAPDPYAKVAAPSYSGCTYTTNPNVLSGSKSFSAAGGTAVFCAGLTIGGGNVTFGSGTYVISGGDLIINGNPTITGSGVTFYFAGDANLTINGTPSVDLTATNTGPLRGLLFFRTTAGTASETINGAPKQSYVGAFYFRDPNDTLTINGNADFAASGCTQIIAGKMIINGNYHTTLANCAGTGVRTGPMAKLVE